MNVCILWFPRHIWRATRFKRVSTEAFASIWIQRKECSAFWFTSTVVVYLYSHVSAIQLHRHPSATIESISLTSFELLLIPRTISTASNMNDFRLKCEYSHWRDYSAEYLSPKRWNSIRLYSRIEPSTSDEWEKILCKVQVIIPYRRSQITESVARTYWNDATRWTLSLLECNDSCADVIIGENCS